MKSHKKNCQLKKRLQVKSLKLSAALLKTKARVFASMNTVSSPTTCKLNRNNKSIKQYMNYFLQNLCICGNYIKCHILHFIQRNLLKTYKTMQFSWKWKLTIQFYPLLQSQNMQIFHCMSPVSFDNSLMSLGTFHLIIKEKASTNEIWCSHGNEDVNGQC